MYMNRLAAFLVCLTLPGAGLGEVAQGPKNVPEFMPAFKNQTRAPKIAASGRLGVTVVARGFAHPWGVEPLPGGGYLLTERVGRLRFVGLNGEVSTIRGTPKVLVQGQGGLLDVALAKDFEKSRRIFLTYSKRQFIRASATAAATGVLNDDMTALTDLKDIFVQTPSSRSPAHYGSRILQAEDNALFITLGEHSSEAERVLAQDLLTSYGKIVRITPDGGIPADNPFRDEADTLGEIWSFGHRNPQGAAIHPKTGQLWTLEHGPAGGDELNQIRSGKNYGWPIVSYGQNYDGSPVGIGKARAPGLVEPQYYWDPVIAPGGFAFYEGDLFDWQGDVVASSLNPGGIVRLTFDGGRVSGEARYLGNLGRVRDIDIDHDGAILILTDDPDGALIRVTPRE